MKEGGSVELTVSNIGIDPATLLLGIYLFGVLAALLTIDARGFPRLGLALLWPLGPLAFIVTITILLAASLIAFPAIAAIALAAALAAALLLLR